MDGVHTLFAKNFFGKLMLITQRNVLKYRSKASITDTPGRTPARRAGARCRCDIGSNAGCGE